MELEEFCEGCGLAWGVCHCDPAILSAKLRVARSHVLLLRQAIEGIFHDHCPCCGDGHGASDEERASTRRLEAALDATEPKP
jgi:hypothetical protein